MGTKMVRKLAGTVSGAGLLLLMAHTGADAFSLGIQLDGYLNQVETAVTGCGLLIGLIGGAGMVVAKMENTYGQFFSGFLNYFVNAGILGGLATILGTLGLVSGAVLPL